MGTKQRREREREGLREEILDAARSLFIKDGYENTSIRKIAQRIEYSPGTIYLYFRDKGEIFDAICEQTFAKLKTSMNAIVADDCDPLEKLRRAGRKYIEFALANPHQYLLTFVDKQTRIDECGADASVIVSSGFACFENFARLVQQCIEADLLRVNDLQEVSQVLWGCMHGVSMLLISCSNFPFIEHTRLVERTLDVAIEGLRKH